MEQYLIFDDFFAFFFRFSFIFVYILVLALVLEGLGGWKHEDVGLEAKEKNLDGFR